MCLALITIAHRFDGPTDMSRRLDGGSIAEASALPVPEQKLSRRLDGGSIAEAPALPVPERKQVVG
jgi:hypothetical protein